MSPYVARDVVVQEPARGQAVLGVAALSCDALSVDGRRARPAQGGRSRGYGPES